MKVLLENDVDVNATDSNGETPLFDAIRSTIKNVSKKKSAVDILLSYGADPNFKNHEGVTPLKVSQRERREEAVAIAKMLQLAEGK